MISEESRQKIRELREQGMNMPYISRELKIGIASVSLWCKRFDKEGIFSKTNQPKTEEQKILVSEIYLSNNNFRQTSEISGFSKYSVMKVIKEMGLYIKEPKTERQISRSKSLHVINWKKDKKLKLIEYKGGKCELCGYNRCENALEFHHINPKNKSFNISTNSFSYERMKEEVDKCALLCANCHKEFHAGLIIL